MSFYRFVPLTDLPPLRQQLHAAAEALELRGSLLLAGEGINGTLAGTRPALEAFRRQLLALEAFAGMRCRFSSAGSARRVFRRLKVRIEPEIVRFGRATAPDRTTGEHVDAARWNALLEDPDVLVLDTRNAYEVAIGTFPGSANPGTRSFGELPGYLERHLDSRRHRRIAMFCTGGIRCEKASSWLIGQGFQDVYQLDGGILGYLETVTPADNRWQGECFVFDERESLNADLEPAALSIAPAPP